MFIFNTVLSFSVYLRLPLSAYSLYSFDEITASGSINFRSIMILAAMPTHLLQYEINPLDPRASHLVSFVAR